MREFRVRKHPLSFLLDVSDPISAEVIKTELLTPLVDLGKGPPLLMLESKSNSLKRSNLTSMTPDRPLFVFRKLEEMPQETLDWLESTMVLLDCFRKE